MKHQLKTIVSIAFASSIFALGIFSSTNAATLFLTPTSSEIGVKEKFTVELRVDSEGVSFNAAQAVIRFPKDTLEVVALDKTGSSFSFWLEEPNFSNTEGFISLIGGTPYGVAGNAVPILKIEFRSKGSGSGALMLSEAAVSAADGSGTNILSKTNDAVFTVVLERVTPKVPESQQIVREAVPTGKLPIKPVLKIPLYPDSTKWSNLISQFNVSWDLPLDITGVSTAFNKEPNFIPTKSEGIFNNKTFSAISDGVWYLHVRFRNNLGWGPTEHYRLAVDTTPPIGFEIVVVEGETTDNPMPTFQFKTNDALSGLKEYHIRIGDGDLIRIPAADFSGTYTLPLQSPGKRQITIKAIDEADNGIENSIILETIPITSPVITFITKELFSDEEKGLTVKGVALPNINVLLRVYRKEALISNGVAATDEKGNFEFTFDQAFKNGNYQVTAQSQDARGALSLIVESQLIKVKSKPIIQIGVFQLGKGGATIFLFLVLIFG